MYKFPEDFEVEKDYWIFCKQHKSVKDARKELIGIIRSGFKIPDLVLVDISRALQKLETMSEQDFKNITHLLFGNYKVTSDMFGDYQDNFRVHLNDREMASE
jgi:hypothetical protein